MKTYTMPDGFEITIVDDRGRRDKELVSEKEVVEKILEKYEEKIREKLEKNKLLLFFLYIIIVLNKYQE